jgi:hypothetical protein
VSEGKWRRKSDDDDLGSLAQSARSTSLKQARGILIALGVLNLVVCGILFAITENLVRQQAEEARQKGGPGMVINEAEVQRVVQLQRMLLGGQAFLGIVFIGLGVAVYRAPVACTVTGLVLYLGLQAVAVALEPESIGRGIFLKVLIIVFLAKSVQAALAYEREDRAAKRAVRDDDVYAEEIEDDHERDRR